MRRLVSDDNSVLATPASTRGCATRGPGIPCQATHDLIFRAVRPRIVFILCAAGISVSAPPAAPTRPLCAEPLVCPLAASCHREWPTSHQSLRWPIPTGISLAARCSVPEQPYTASSSAPPASEHLGSHQRQAWHHPGPRPPSPPRAWIRHARLHSRPRTTRSPGLLRRPWRASRRPYQRHPWHACGPAG
jgi:hypothetical protein